MGPIDYALIGAIVVLAMILAVIPALIAGDKGRNPILFYAFGLVAWPIALVVAIRLDHEVPQAGEVVMVQAKLESDNGERVDQGHVGRVLAVEEGPEGTVAKVETPAGDVVEVSPKLITRT